MRLSKTLSALSAAGLSMLPNSGFAEARSMVQTDGRTIIAAGGSLHSLNADDSGVRAMLDDHVVRITDGTIVIDGRSAPLPSYEMLAIRLGPEGLQILVDGEALATPGEK